MTQKVSFRKGFFFKRNVFENCVGYNVYFFVRKLKRDILRDFSNSVDHFFLNELSKGKNNKWREKRYRSTTLSPSTSVKPVMMASTMCWLDYYYILPRKKRESKKLFAQSTLACFQKMHSALLLLFKFLWVVKQCFFFCAKCSPPFHFLYWCKKFSIANLVVWKLG